MFGGAIWGKKVFLLKQKEILLKNCEDFCWTFFSWHVNFKAQKVLRQFSQTMRNLNCCLVHLCVFVGNIETSIFIWLWQPNKKKFFSFWWGKLEVLNRLNCRSFLSKNWLFCKIFYKNSERTVTDLITNQNFLLISWSFRTTFRWVGTPKWTI